MQPKLWAYMAGIARNHEFLVLANGGMEDHVHLLASRAGIGQGCFPTEIKFVNMDEGSWVEFFMARGIRSIQRERVKSRSREALHRQPGKAPSQNHI